MLAGPQSVGGKEEPTFAEVKTCVQWLRDATSLGEDNIITPLLKAGAEAIA
jgi:hypothetical protein